MRVAVRYSKGNQEGQGQEVAIPHGARLRPDGTVRTWLNAAVITGGPAFRRMDNAGRVGAEAGGEAASSVRRTCPA